MFKVINEVWSSLQSRDKRYLSLALWLIAIIGFSSIFILPFFFSLPAPFPWMGYSASTSNVANTVNGIATPFIAIAAAILTFLAFWVQYQANVQQRQQFLDQLKIQREDALAQDKVWRIERFENRYYELLKLHRANVDEMNIADKVKGRKCFIHMFDELRMVYNTLAQYMNATAQEVKMEFNYNSIHLLSLSYNIFFFGIGPQSEKHFTKGLSKGEAHLFNEVKPILEDVQRRAWAELRDERSFYYDLPLTDKPDKRTIEFYYFPFDGHVNRLGHYYRHLYQTATYIINAKFLDEDQKYEFIKTLRAQLSNFEQLMLYYNALAWFPDQWHKLFTDYRLIKNLPLTLADFYKRPEDYFKDDIERLRKKKISMFEWHE
jgi:hypothetical protein